MMAVTIKPIVPAVRLQPIDRLPPYEYFTCDARTKTDTSITFICVSFDFFFFTYPHACDNMHGWIRIKLNYFLVKAVDTYVNNFTAIKRLNVTTGNGLRLPHPPPPTPPPPFGGGWLNREGCLFQIIYFRRNSQKFSKLYYHANDKIGTGNWFCLQMQCHLYPNSTFRLEV